MGDFGVVFFIRFCKIALDCTLQIEFLLLSFFLFIWCGYTAFLARKDRFRLMALSEVYIVGSDANRFLALFEVQTCWPILAMLLHVEYMESGIHRGSVILMDYPELVRDVALFDRLPDTQREGHIKQLITRCVRYAPQCMMVDLIEYLKTGR